MVWLQGGLTHSVAELVIKAPGGIIYEPDERALAIGRPFAWWSFLLALDWS
jgi:hypothetical protein